MASHPIVHVEISAKDPVAAGKFYADVFGWKVETDPQFNYTQFQGEGGPGGGFVKPDETYKVGDIVPYLDTDDIDATLRKIESAGGKVMLPKTEIPGQGWFAFFSDPTGNRMGLYTSVRPHAPAQ